jgi:hypothetical protein
MIQLASKLTRTLVGTTFLALLTFPSAQAATTIAFDSQADPAYSTWDPGDNGGFGWGGGWTFRDQANSILTVTDSRKGWFVASSTNNNSITGDSNGDGDINSASTGRAWGLYSNTTTNDIYAIRPLATSLSVGETISLDLDNGSIASSQVVGFRLLTNPSDINSRDWEFRFVGGGTNYTIVNSAGTGNNTGIPFSREGLHVDLTMTGATNYMVVVRGLLTGQTITNSGAFVTASPILGIALKNQEAGSGSVSDAYFNNLSITTVVPEPGVAALALGFLAFAFKRRARS